MLEVLEGLCRIMRLSGLIWTLGVEINLLGESKVDPTSSGIFLLPRGTKGKFQKPTGAHMWVEDAALETTQESFSVGIHPREGQEVTPRCFLVWKGSDKQGKDKIAQERLH